METHRGIMLKNISQLSDKINGKDYQFICDNDSPTTDVKEFCFRVLAYVAKVEDKIKEMQDKAEADAAAAQPAEAVLPVVEELVQPQPV